MLYLNICIYIYIYIYIYINIYCHSQPDCFFVLQHFSEARHLLYCKLGSKPDWLYVSPISCPTANVILCVSEGTFLHIRYRLPGCSINKKSSCVQLLWFFLLILKNSQKLFLHAKPFYSSDDLRSKQVENNQKIN